MSLTASVLWLGGGSEDLAKQRHKNGAYSVGNHDNADIIGSVLRIQRVNMDTSHVPSAHAIY